ncbi:hypothetical protein M0805_003668 [Coniferiporia weirii]|nr:hypothetical protein M0805_003668 [Coniferiporia weirii]
MATCIDTWTPEATCPPPCLPPVANVKAWCPSTALRTYLWAMSLQDETSLYGDSCGHPLLSGIYPETADLASLSITGIDVMAQDLMVHDHSDRLYTPTRRTAFPTTSRLRHAISYETNVRYSLPDSPLNPRLAHPSVPSLFADHRSLSPPPSSLGSESDYTSDMSLAPLEEPGRSTRGRGLTTRPAPLSISPAPSIILTPSSAGTRRNSFISLFSSVSDYPSEPASSVYDDDFDSISVSESVQSDLSEESPSTPPSTLCARVLQGFKASHAEDVNVPTPHVSENALRYASFLHSAREVLTIDESEFLNAQTLLHPGAHGFVAPCTAALADLLALHAQCNPGGCHLFVSQEGRYGKGVRYRYHGFYRVVQKDTSNSKKLPGCTDEPPTFFLEFLHYDWELFDLMDRYTRPDAQSVSVQDSNTGSFSRKENERKHTQKQSEGPVTRIITVDGVNFEMATLPVR